MNSRNWIVTVMALGVVVAVAGCGGSKPVPVRTTFSALPTPSTASTSVPTPGTSTTTSSSTVSTGVPAPACQTSQLRLSLGQRISEATEQNTLSFVLRNASATACELRGYPRVALLDGHGSPLPFRYLDRGDQMLTSSSPSPVPLAAGAKAYLAINKNSCVGHTTRISRQIAVTPPGQSRQLTLKLNRFPSISYCSAADPGHTVDISPVMQSFRAVLAAH